jgi:hypothetical protein
MSTIEENGTNRHKQGEETEPLMNSESSQSQVSKEKRPREEEGQEEEGQPDPQKQRTVATDTWEQIFDQAYKKYYYYNRRTGESVWERPEDAYVVPASSPLSSSSISSSSSLSSTATPSAIPGTDYTTIQVHETGFVEQGSTNNGGGLGEGVSENGLALSSQISEVAYLDRGFAPSDHMGQQMYEFFDPAQLERNRNEAKARKQALKNKNIDWKKYQQQQKKRREKIKNKWLYDNEEGLMH